MLINIWLLCGVGALLGGLLLVDWVRGLFARRKAERRLKELLK